jgi:hypothetical protein
MTYYLLEHPNPNCIDRGDGRYHGYMQMQAQPVLITVHTTESLADLIAPDTGAEAVANYFATTSHARQLSHDRRLRFDGGLSAGRARRHHTAHGVPLLRAQHR